MKVTFKPCRLAGTISAPPSKSMAHRLLISAALADGESEICGISDSEDISATVACLNALGVDCKKVGNTVTVKGIDVTKAKPNVPLPCHESGSTLRFLIPLCLMSGNPGVLEGSQTLLSRPLSVYEKICRERNIRFEKKSETVLEVQGKLTGGDYKVDGNISSQFISGLLFALPLAGSDSRILINPPIESEPYLHLTLQALSLFGIKASFTDERTIGIPGGQHYRAGNMTVEGDYSNAAFLDALNLFEGNAVTVTGLRSDSLQGDKVYREYFEKLCMGTPTLHIGNCPDLAPILMAVAAAKNGAVFCGTHRLRMKESDRGTVMAEELKKFGASVSVWEDSIVVYPADFHAPTVPLQGHNDHRIVMALSTLLLQTGGCITGAEAVRKSFPDYFDCLHRLGGENEVIIDEMDG